jgi:uncharacterized membrane protein YfcA
MSIPSGASQSGRTRRRKPLNVPLIKSMIVLFMGSLTAFGSALTGIGAQVVFAPLLTWMLGFSLEKAKGTALRYTIFVSLSTLIGVFLVQGTGNIVGYCWRGELLAIGATVGALMALPLAPKPAQLARRRLMQSLGVLLCLFVVIQAGHLSRLTQDSLHYAHWNSWWALLILGTAVGILTQVTGLAGGVIMVPALYFLGGFNAFDSIALSLFVVALVSLLPAWSYSKQGIADTTYGNYAVIGGLIGGLLGGIALMRFQEKFLLIFFGAVAMFLSARELYRINMETIPAQEPPSESNRD